MTMTIKRAIAALVFVAACDQPHPVAEAQPTGAGASAFAEAPDVQWRLPSRLKEISGLAVTRDGRLFGHDDERGVIYEINVDDGAFAKAFAIGDPVEAGDFEGLAIDGEGAFWMTTSHGRLYRFREGADGEHVAFERFDSGLRDVCEVEGLAYVAPEDGLILACKENHVRGMRDQVTLYRWRAEGGAAELWRSWPEADLAMAAGVRRFRPSSLDFNAERGQFVLLSARDGALVELNAAGEVLAARALGSGHAQAEGAAIMPDGALVIADEGSPALVSRYPGARDD